MEPGLVKLLRARNGTTTYHPRVCSVQSVDTWEVSQILSKFRAFSGISMYTDRKVLKKLSSTIRALFPGCKPNIRVFSPDMCVIHETQWEGVFAVTTLKIFHVEC